MSGLYLLALIALWLFLGWVIYRFWKLWQPTGAFGKVLRISVGILVFSVWFGGAFWQVSGKKMYWDARVREMCAQDGGVKVYETVELLEERFDKWGMVKFYHPNMKEQALGPKYEFYLKEKYLREEKPTIIRSQCSIFRKADGKMLGELVYYIRRGGDLPGFWHESSFSCPDNVGINNFIKAVFVKSVGEKE